VSENAPRSRTSLWLIFLLCVAPVAASYYVYYFAAPGRHVNYGELVETRPLPEVRLQLADGSEFTTGDLRGKWVLLMADAGACGTDCRNKLFALRQLRLTQGRDMTRIERVWLITDSALPAADVMAPFAGTWLVRAAGSELLKALPATAAPADHLYVVDPLGNLVLRYPRDADPSRIIKDLARLLKTSGIG
jgi:cytochrome oxidase Cu insertion factor (SCO1/SenC/PrrC family)